MLMNCTVIIILFLYLLLLLCFLHSSFFGILGVGKDRARIKVSQVESSWKKKGKQLKDGEFDLNSVMPWKLDFNTNDKEATFWLWEQKWRTFYNFIGQFISTQKSL